MATKLIYYAAGPVDPRLRAALDDQLTLVEAVPPPMLPQQLADGGWDAALVPVCDDLAPLDLVRAHAPDLPAIILALFPSVAQAVAAMRRGADDYLPLSEGQCDWLRAALDAALRRALAGRRAVPGAPRAGNPTGVPRAGVYACAAELATPYPDVYLASSAHERAGAELRHVMQLERAVFNSTACGIIALDIRGVIQVLNPAAEQMLGYITAEVRGSTPAIWHTPGDWETMTSEVTAWFHAGGGHPARPYTCERRFVRKDGRYFSGELSLNLTHAEDGTPIGFLGVVVDVSDHRRIEAELRQANEDLSRVNEQLAHAARLKDAFIASMSHELRTPLSVILGRIESLREGVYGELNEQQERSARSIEESSQQLLSLINDVLDLSKIEAGQLILRLEAVAPEPVCHASLRVTAAAATPRNITLTTHVDPLVHRVQADERRLRQMLTKLLANAVKFTPDGGDVRLEVAGDAAGGVVRFSVSDTGIGIASDDLPRLFQPFVQLDSGLSRHYSGSGLGLTLVARLAELHGGQVSVESAPGAGSRFILALPWASDQPRERGPNAITTTCRPAPAICPEEACAR